MRQNDIRDAISKLALSEKLILVEDIWDSIAINNDDLPLPEWQTKELDKRYEAYNNGKAGLNDWETVHKDLRVEDG